MRALVMAIAVLAIGGGCGSSTPPTQTDDGASSDACAGYRAGDPCITEENLAQCREMAARCPGAVLVLESCPLQFACP
ncbi:hypothetical protein [Sandaracinus amylolyticus]|uniref:hypothetical protein n=1 Tax=Sandaracinus amylolyticus TaxID=927083 RepID=UPI001F414BB7|nr:hypothetical protein [Sandaracinus amylolyticus]UJR86652.1 Hypothetical protein I5071_87530 [Sandaracinus amylolyticus]